MELGTAVVHELQFVLARPLKWPFSDRRTPGILGYDARRITAVTCTGVQTPPRAVATPPALRALAIARNVTGSTLAAKRSARLGFGPPSSRLAPSQRRVPHSTHSFFTPRSGRDGLEAGVAQPGWTRQVDAGEALVQKKSPDMLGCRGCSHGHGPLRDDDSLIVARSLCKRRFGATFSIRAPLKTGPPS
jgi:hypothetical protein